MSGEKPPTAKVALVGHWTENLGDRASDRLEVVLFDTSATLADLLAYAAMFRMRLEIVPNVDAAKALEDRRNTENLPF